MSKIKELRQRKADLVKEARGATADGAKFEELKAEIERVNAAIEREETLLEYERQLVAVKDALEQGDAQEVRGSHVEEPKGPRLFKSLGEQLQAVAKAATTGTVDPRLAQVNAAAGMNEAVGSEGGFLVQQDFAAEIFRRVYETGQILQRVRRIRVSGNGLVMNAVDETSRATGSRFGGIRGYWQGEGATKLASKPKFRQIRLDLKKLTGLAYATDELLQDAMALGDILGQGFTEEFEFLLENAIFRGKGAGEPLGIVEGGALVSVAKEGGQAGATLKTENLVKMWSRLWGKSRPEAVVLINQDVEPQLFTMTLGGTIWPAYLPPNGLSQSPYGTLFGRPVIPVEYCDTLGKKGDVVFADFSQYMMIEKGGIQAAQSIHVKFEEDETTFRFVLRADGQPIWNAPLTPFKSSNTLSPFVTLDERA